MYYPHSQHSKTMSSINFAFTVPDNTSGIGIGLVGNMGAPLRTGADDVMQHEEIYISQNPLAFGLDGGVEGANGPTVHEVQAEETNVVHHNA